MTGWLWHSISYVRTTQIVGEQAGAASKRVGAVFDNQKLVFVLIDAEVRDRYANFMAHFLASVIHVSSVASLARTLPKQSSA